MTEIANVDPRQLADDLQRSLDNPVNRDELQHTITGGVLWWQAIIRAVRASATVTPTVCGQNPAGLRPERVGCGRYILSEKDLFRCTDCETPFHKNCAIHHFGTHYKDGLKGVDYDD